MGLFFTLRGRRVFRFGLPFNLKNPNRAAIASGCPALTVGAIVVNLRYLVGRLGVSGASFALLRISEALGLTFILLDRLHVGTGVNFVLATLAQRETICVPSVDIAAT